MATRYKLIAPYPNHQIGDIAVYDPRINDEYFVWEKSIKESQFQLKEGVDYIVIPKDFQPDQTPEWFELIEDEKTLDYYEYVVNEKQYQAGTYYVGLAYLFKHHNPRIYWTEVLKVIAQDLNKSKLVQYCIGRTPVLHWRANNKEPIRYIVTSDTSAGIKQGIVYFDEVKSCQKAIDLLGSNVKHLFNE